VFVPKFRKGWNKKVGWFTQSKEWQQRERERSFVENKECQQEGQQKSSMTVKPDCPALLCFTSLLSLPSPFGAHGLSKLLNSIGGGVLISRHNLTHNCYAGVVINAAIELWHLRKRRRNSPVPHEVPAKT
jgi:hypothetical protein